MTARISPEHRKWWTLGAVSFGLFMIMLDNTVVNVALPSIQRDLGARLSELEWIVAGYALTFAALLLVGGKLADMFGRRRVFVVGLGIFTASSLACALAPNPQFLIGARVVQGIGAALMSPATLSIISATFPPRERGQAIGIWAGVAALALSIGPFVGGVLTEHVGWSSIFFVNVPIGVVAIAASLLLIEESKDTSEGQRLDLPGLLSSALGLFALTYGLIEANDYGWILGALAIAAVALASFVVLERRQRRPMLELALFHNATFTGANLVVLLVALAQFGVLFFVSLYMQNVLGYSPVRAGTAFLPMTVLIVAIAPLAGRVSDRMGSRWLMTGGMMLVALQLFYFLEARRPRELRDPRAGNADRRRRHSVRDVPVERRRPPWSPRRPGRRWIGGRQHIPPGWRFDRHRSDGRNRGARDRRPADTGGVRPRILARAHRRGGDRLRRSARRGHAGALSQPRPSR
jgi:EmrB/QacA subfamily drug resistance transporter